MNLTRRQLIVLAGSAGLALLAGCVGRSTPGPGSNSKRLPIEPEYGTWFDGVSNYDGTYDLRGRSDVSVDVGVKGGMGYYKFGPAASTVSPGTTVTWRWTGKGGDHDVRAVNDTFRSPLAKREGHTFSHTFEAPGVYRYYCTPHEGMGMKGAVFVALEE